MPASAESTDRDLAARASALWATVEPAGSPPASVETLKPGRRKSGVVRLLGAGADGRPVIAKRAARESIEIEARVYRDVLAFLPVSATRLLGTAPDGERSWLFLEDAGDTRFDSGREDHRRLAAAWMAAVHGGARALPGVDELPARDPAHYGDLRQTVAALLRKTLGNPALSAEEAAVVERVVEACDALEARWASVEAALEEGPQTIVFGGFSSKNAHVRTTASRTVLMPFDFESAGRGCPAIDLVYLDGEAYLQEARGWWEGLDGAELERQRGVGRALGGLKAIPGEHKVLLGSAPPKAVAKLEWYGREMVEGIGAVEA